MAILFNPSLFEVKASSAMSTVPYCHLGQLPKLGSWTSPTPSSPEPESSLEGPCSLRQAENTHCGMDSARGHADCQAAGVAGALLLLCRVGDEDGV